MVNTMTHTAANPGAAAYHPQATQSYRQQQVLTSSPLGRLLIVYDVALQACAQQDLERFGRALGVLRDSLDLSQGEVGASLLSLYTYCGDVAREGGWDEAARILRELRDTWETVGGDV